MNENPAYKDFLTLKIDFEGQILAILAILEIFVILSIFSKEQQQFPLSSLKLSYQLKLTSGWVPLEGEAIDVFSVFMRIINTIGQGQVHINDTFTRMFKTPFLDLFSFHILQSSLGPFIYYVSIFFLTSTLSRSIFLLF